MISNHSVEVKWSGLGTSRTSAFQSSAFYRYFLNGVINLNLNTGQRPLNLSKNCNDPGPGYYGLTLAQESEIKVCVFDNVMFGKSVIRL